MQALERIISDDPDRVMPKGAAPFSNRAPGDAIVEFADLLEAWIAAGRPGDAFYLPRAAKRLPPATLLSEDVGMHMTNLGNCIPPRQMVGIETPSRMQALDDDVRRAHRRCPKRLEQTDLISSTPRCSRATA